MTQRLLDSIKATLLMPANIFALAAGGLASLVTGDWVPLAAAGGASVLYLTLLSTAPSFRRAVQVGTWTRPEVSQTLDEALQGLLGDLSPSQLQHYESLRELRNRILATYAKLPGGRVLVATSERRLDALLASFVRLVGTLNSYRKFLTTPERQAIEAELGQLESEVALETNLRLRDVKARRVEILKKRVTRFLQAEESREVVSHQLASIEDLLRLAHEQSIAIRDPEAMTQALDGLSSEVAATEETVRELEQFMQLGEELSPESSSSLTRERVR
jgi:hypothetical protein